MCINKGYFLTNLASSSSFRKWDFFGDFFIVTFTHPKKKTPIKIKMCPFVIQKLCLKPNIILLTIPKFEMNWNWNHT